MHHASALAYAPPLSPCTPPHTHTHSIGQGCGLGMGAMDYFGEAAAMPAFATLAGVRDRALTSPAALWRLSLRTLILLGGALLVAHYSPVAERAWWFYRYMVFAPNKGVLKAPSREFFRMHAWFMVSRLAPQTYLKLTVPPELCSCAGVLCCPLCRAVCVT